MKNCPDLLTSKGDKPRKKKVDYSDEAVGLLAAAVIVEAARDLRAASRLNDKRDVDRLTEYFLSSPDFAFWNVFDLDPQAVVNAAINGKKPIKPILPGKGDGRNIPDFLGRMIDE